LINSNILDYCIEGADNIGEIVYKKCIQQEIKNIGTNTLCGISLKFGTYGRINKGLINIALLDKNSKKVLYTSDIDISTLEDCRWFSISFPAVKNLKILTIIITPVNTKFGSSVTLFYDRNRKDSFIKIWNEIKPGCLGLRLHFDKEYYPDNPFLINNIKETDECKLTICCLTYNHVNFIKKTLDGFLNQITNFKFKILIWDDASTDGTSELISNYRNKFPDIIDYVLSPVNISPEKSFLELLSRAKTEYIALCEGDDYWVDFNKLQKQVDFLDKNKEYSMCFHPVLVKDDEGVKQDYQFPDKKSHPILYKKNYLQLEDLVYQNYIQTNSAVYRWRYKDLDISSHYPEDTLPGDWYIHLLHAEIGKIGYIDDIMSVYRRHSGGIWSGGNDKVIKKYGKQHANFFKNLDIHFKGKFESLFKKNETSLLRKHADLNKVKKTISVIVPTYNHESYIQECINSVLNQKGNFNLEIIVGNDNSSDSTQEIISQFDKLKILNHSKNLGLHNNLKECVKHCTGDYIAICEGDDYWTSPWRLYTLLEFMENKPKSSMCFNLLVMKDKDKYITNNSQYSLENNQLLKPSNFIDCNYPANFSCCFYKKEVFDIVLNKAKGSSDWIINTMASTYGEVYFIKQKMSVWRIHDKGSWNSLSYQKKIQVINSVKKDIVNIINESDRNI